MAEEHGTKNVEIALNLLLELGNVGDKIGQPNQEGVAKYMHLTELFDEVAALGGFNAEELKKEAGELSDDEVKALNDKLKSKLDLVDDALEGKIEQLIDLFIKSYGLYEEITAFVKSVKAMKES